MANDASQNCEESKRGISGISGIRCAVPSRSCIEHVVTSALREDLGGAGDITSQALVPPETMMDAIVVAREHMTVCGLPYVRELVRQTDGAVSIDSDNVVDGTPVQAESTILRLRGSAVEILQIERSLLNLLAHLSGISTLTACYVAAAKGQCSIAGTRKTMPGMRAAQHYAISCGGGSTHRSGLFDAVLIKDNHLAALGGNLACAISRAKRTCGHMRRIAIEVDSIEQAREALACSPDVLLLDNFTCAEVVEAIDLRRAMNREHVMLEASGGITLSDIEQYASTGIDVISVGALTHSARSVDVGLDAVPL